MESTHSCCLAVRCISELLLQTTLYPVPGNPSASAYLHRPRHRDLPFLGSRWECPVYRNIEPLSKQHSTWGLHRCDLSHTVTVPKRHNKIAFYCADVGGHGFTQSFLLYPIVFFIHFSGHMLWLLGIVVVPRPIEGKSLLFGRKRYLKKFLELNVTRCFDSLGIGNYETGEQSVPFVFRVIKIRGRSKVWRLSEMYNW